MPLTSRTTVRRWVGRLLGETFVATATQAGTTLQFTDEEKLARENGSLAGRLAYYSGGTAANLGTTRRVAGNAKSSATLTVGRAWPAASAIGDELELWNEREVGAAPDEVHEAINRYLLSVADKALAPVTAVPAAFAWSSPVIALDPTWFCFSGADWQDRSGEWVPVPWADLRVDPTGRTVELRNRPRTLAGGNLVRVRGHVSPTSLATDDATTAVDAQWLATAVAAELAATLAGRTASPERMERRGAELRLLAQPLSFRVPTTPVGRCVELR